MVTVMDPGTLTPMSRGRPGAARPSCRSLTLSALITAIQHVLGPEDDGLVVATVWHLLRAGRLTGLGTGTQRYPPQCQETGRRRRWQKGGEVAWEGSYWSQDRSRCSWGLGRWSKLPDTGEEGTIEGKLR
jgi:hypothetical protein